MNSLEKYLVFIRKPDTIYGSLRSPKDRKFIILAGIHPPSYGAEVPFCFIVWGKIFGGLFGSFGSLL